MEESPHPMRLAQTLGLTSSSILSGFVLAVSFTLTPRILESPTPLMLRQWGNMFEAGKKSAPPFAAVSALSYFYLAYVTSRLSHLPVTNAHKLRVWGYAVAGLLTVGIVPYKLAVMGDVNRKLLKKVEETRGLSVKDEVVEVGLGEETAHKLVDRWGVLNLGRAGMLIVGSVVGTWTALN